MKREAKRGDNAGDCTQEDDKTASSNVGIGRTGENAALEYLLQNGYKLLERNWHCRHKEVDLIVETAQPESCGRSLPPGTEDAGRHPLRHRIRHT